MTIQQDREFIKQFYGEESCIEESFEEDIESYEEAIFIYSDMLRNAILRKDHEEIALCKKELQEAKCGKRRMLAS